MNSTRLPPAMSNPPEPPRVVTAATKESVTHKARRRPEGGRAPIDQPLTRDQETTN